MHIIHIGAEMAPIAKVGGLGDVILGLSRELIQQGHTAEVILPKYASLHYSQVEGLQITLQDLWVFCDGQWQHNTVWTGWVSGIRVYLIESHSPPYYFARERIYGYEDDIERFLYFSRAAVEFLHAKQLNPDIFHLHEWPAAAVAPLYRDQFQSEGGEGPKLVITLHNLQHQGHCRPDDLDKIGLQGADYLDPDRMQDDQNPELINLLKGGILYSDWVTTVSPTYAKEIQTPTYGLGLDPTMRIIRDRCTGILNGLDHHVWGPNVDPFLPAPYSWREMDNKYKSKKLLRERLGLRKANAPLVGCVTRLVPQKGIHMIKYALMRTLEAGGQFVLLGSSAIPEINREFNALKIHFSNHPDVHLELHHNEEITRLIFAGSDMFIVPSLFEPCGLTQLIAKRYGSVPIVRKTGGLADTIFDIDNSTKPRHIRNGFTFDEPTIEGFETAFGRSLDLWHADKERWQELMVAGMSRGGSWEKPCEQYLAIYERLASWPKVAATGSGG